MAGHVKFRLNGVRFARRLPRTALLGIATSVLVAVVGLGASATSSGPKGATILTASATMTATTDPVVPTGASLSVNATNGAGLHSDQSGRAALAATLRTAKTFTTETTGSARTTKSPRVAHVRKPVARRRGSNPPTTTTTTAPPTTTAAPARYPIGVANTSAPSGYGPPSGSALPGYIQSYVTDFSGSALPTGWVSYSGKPMGDPGAQFGTAHVVVSGGLLQLNTWRDPQYNNAWVTGGLSQSAVTNTYGAYFVRSRLTGAGPTGVELLWPADNSWPPEIDFSETGGDTSSLSATVHFGPASINHIDQRTLSKVDMTKWHTWGVVWTPTAITYTVDGSVWGSVGVAAAIPNVPMTLDLQQQTWCDSGWACPSTPQSMLVDWVAEYRAG